MVIRLPGKEEFEPAYGRGSERRQGGGGRRGWSDGQKGEEGEMKGDGAKKRTPWIRKKYVADPSRRARSRV